MPTKTISTIQQSQQLDATHGLLISSGLPVKLLRLQGTVTAGATTDKYYLQLHNSTTVPANTSVPLRTFTVAGASAFDFEFNEPGIDAIQLSTLTNSGALILVVSSTEATLTIVAGNVEAFVDIEWGILPVQGYDTAIGTSQHNVTVWATTSSSDRLVYAKIVETAGAASYIQLYADTTIATAGQAPLMEWAIAANGTKILDFGVSGIPVLQNLASNPNTRYKGCYIGFSLTSGSYDGAGTCSYTIIYI